MVVPTKTALIVLTGMISLILVTFQSCKKITDHNVGSASSWDTLKIPDLKTKVTTSISGFITDHDDIPVNGAVVSAGSSIALTDQFGYFEINNASVVEEAAVVTVVKPGYYAGIQTFIAISHQNEFFRMTLIPLASYNSGTIDASQGGTFSSWDGGWTFSVTIAANGVVNAANNTPYNGLIYLNAVWVWPMDFDFQYEGPGDLRGLDTSGFIRLLSIHAIEFVQLKGTAGEELKLTKGKSATVSLELSSGSSASEPPTIPLWSFNNTSGLWQEEGIATKTGTAYTGETKDLSSICVGLPINFVHFKGKITDQSGKAVPYAVVNIPSVPSSLNVIPAFSDSAGLFSGIAPANTLLQLQISGMPGTGTPVLTQELPASQSDISLGTLVVPSQNLVTLEGSITDCSGHLINDGDVILKGNTFRPGGYYHYGTSGTGAFAFNIIYANTNQTSDSVSILSEQKSTGELGNALVIIPNPGINNLGRLSTCGTSRNVQFSCTLVSGSGVHLQNVWAGVTNVSNPSDTLWILTDSSGNVHGILSENSRFIINISASQNCGNTLYSKTFSTGMSNVSLGNIVVTGLSIANVTGTVLDCNGLAVTSGYLLVDKDAYRLNIPLGNTGTFAFSTNVCNTTTSDPISVIPVNGTTGQAGKPLMISINEGNNTISALQACVTADLTQQYINYSIDGSNYSYSSPANTISQSSDYNTHFTYIGASVQPYTEDVFISFYNNGIGVGSSNFLDEFHCPQLQWSIVPPIYVSITEYGPVGGYLSGYFAGKVEKSSTDTTAHDVICNFRVKRNQ
ncbi:MAG: hypothetical protein ABI472_01310 [Ginsengibacter sp.]